MTIVLNDGKKYKCAILMATHNGADYLSDQLLSIQSQDNVECTVFYSDDCSNDATISILTSFGATPLSDEPLKFGRSSKNFLWAIANFHKGKDYDYIFLSDQDDIWLPNKCFSAIEKMQTNNMQCYSSGYYRWIQSKNKITFVNKFYQQNAIDFLFRSPGPGFTYCFRADAYAKLTECVTYNYERMAQSMWHDWLLYALSRKLRLSWIIDTNAYALYRQHENNETGQAILLSDYIDRLLFLLNGKYRQEIMKLPGLEQHTKICSALTNFTLADRIYLISKIPLMRSSFTDRFALLLWLMFEHRLLRASDD